MLLGIFSFLIAIICPPLAALLWQGSKLSTHISLAVWCIAVIVFFQISAAGGMLIHGLLIFHTMLLLIFRSNNGLFNPTPANDQPPYLYAGAIFFTLVVSSIIFQTRISSEQRITLDSEAVANGKRLFTTCTVCHYSMTRKNKVGPHLVGILGREAGAISDYEYSDSMAQANFFWTDEKLVEFLENPNELLPGTRMMITPMAKEDAADIVEYLKSK